MLRPVHQTNPPEGLPSFDLADLLKMFPNIVVYRGFGKWGQFRSPPLSRHDTVLEQILGLRGERGDETHGGAHELHGSESDVPDTGRRIELCFAFGWQLNFARSIPTPRTLTLPRIHSMELQSLRLFMATILTSYDKIQLPNLAHLALRNADSFEYATTRLVLPSLRSVTLVSDTERPFGFSEESFMEIFFEKYGLALEELTMLAEPYSEYPQRLDQLCPILHTFRTHYRELLGSPIPSVRTVGLYSLEHAPKCPESGESTSAGVPV
ncbi:hypothetical protein M407DRAFT_35176 [Tulasnella calospora MUT 4182]|uniref:Uncharacterized protein n=1 Tax=Tulasnella calospora MUT 4182 TaxID=1051891 RepID=A0A0C3Q092_9AGAM|nr:hypothetical protein M407DRAFT_35176 [Tulasnella calospora MUT 4182]